MGWSVNEKRKVELGGLRQKIHVWSRDRSRPLLLSLHGGPGIPNREKLRSSHLDLCDAFTLVGWDQRGTGGSYAGCPPETLTLDRLVEDAAELITRLCAEFGQERAFILGGSWGTELGTFLALRHPGLVAGYVGYGQVVNGIANEDLSYAYTLRKAKEAGDAKSIEVLERVGPPVKGVYDPVFDGLLAQRRILSLYGGHTVGKGNYLLDTAMPILASPEYGLRDMRGILKGSRFTLENMWPSIVDYDFVRGIEPHFEMPYYIFQGVHDNTTPSDLVQEYYDAIQAPDKDLIWFEHSAHGPMSEEPERFKRLLREKLLG